MVSDADIDAQAKIVWDYHLMNHKLKKSDCIFGLCSHDPRVAERAAELYLNGWAPLLIFSGGVGALTEGLYEESEAEHFAKIAIEMGVPEEKILVEPLAKNTGENVQLTQKLLTSRNLSPESYILVQKPFMERRTFATFMKHLPDANVVVTSPQISYSDYPNDFLSKEVMLNTMLGDLQRIDQYPSLGFQIPQEIPERVWSAFEKLVSWGFDKHLIKQN